MRYYFLLISFLCLSGCHIFQTHKHAFHTDSHAFQKNKFDVWVDKNHTNDATHFSTIESAINAAPAQTKKPFRIFIAAGDYYEKITINQSNIELIGASAKKTRLYYDAYAGQLNPQSTPWGTPGSATLTIKAKNIRIENMRIENSFNFFGNDGLAADDPKKVSNTQAVALFLDQGSDKIIVRNTQILGNQDTLFINDGRSWFDHVLIAGNVDFIFGKGNAVFTQSEIKNLARAKPGVIEGFVTAPSTQIKQNYGFTFIDCKLTRANNVSDHAVALGRPWHPTTQFSDGRYADPNAIGKSVFISCWMDAHINLEGWYSMKGTAKDGTKIDFLPEDSRFFEYQSRGPGALVNSTRRQISASDIEQYELKKIWGDWQPQ